MDYLQTTGDRLHDLELDRILSRLRTLETARGTSETPTQAIAPPPPTISVGVRSLTPGSGTPMFNDIALVVSGPLTISQSAQSITLTCTAAASPATSVTAIAAGGVVGTATTFAREDHVHAGVHKITGSAAAQGDLVFTGAGVSQSGNTFTFAGSGGGTSFEAVALTLAPTNWIVPSAPTEWLGSDLYRGKFDASNATQARLILTFHNPALVVAAPPTFEAQFSANGGATWSALLGSSGPSVLYSGGTQDSGWGTIAVGAQADILLRIVGSGGNGSASIVIGLAMILFK